MSGQVATRKDIEDVLGVLDVMMTRFDERFNTVESTQTKQNEEIQRILARLDHIDKRLEINEQERLVLGHQLERLDKWVHELAAKIDYKLFS